MTFPAYQLKRMPGRTRRARCARRRSVRGNNEEKKNDQTTQGGHYRGRRYGRVHSRRRHGGDLSLCRSDDDVDHGDHRHGSAALPAATAQAPSSPPSPPSPPLATCVTDDGGLILPLSGRKARGGHEPPRASPIRTGSTPAAGHRDGGRARDTPILITGTTGTSRRRRWAAALAS